MILKEFIEGNFYFLEEKIKMEEKERPKIKGDLSCPYSSMINNQLTCEVPANSQQVDGFPVFVAGECNCTNYLSCEFYSEPEKKESSIEDGENALEKWLHRDKPFFE
jgi:hypothetical protein